MTTQILAHPVYNATNQRMEGINRTGSIFYWNVSWATTDNTSLDTWTLSSNQTGVWVNETRGTNWVFEYSDGIRSWYWAVMNFTITALQGSIFQIRVWANETGYGETNETIQTGYGTIKVFGGDKFYYDLSIKENVSPYVKLKYKIIFNEK